MSIFGSNSSSGLSLAQLQAESTNADELAAALATVKGTISGQVIDYMGTTTPSGFEDVDAHPVQNTGAVKWAMRCAPSGGNAAIVTSTFCAVGNRLFCLMWNQATATDGGNIRAAVTLDESDLDTITLRSRQPHTHNVVACLAAAPLDSDRVLVLVSSQAYAQTYSMIYTISTDTWTVVANFASTWYPVLSAVTLNSGKVLCVAYNNVARVYDPVANSWTDTGAMVKPAGYLTKMSDGRVLLVGAKYDLASTTAAIYNPATNAWSSAAAVPAGLKQTMGVLLSDGRIAVSGNNVANSFYIYNPATNAWASNTFSFNKGSAANNLAASATLANGRVFCPWGQYNGGQGSFGTTDTCWTGWHMLEMLSPDVARFSSEIRKIRKV